MKIILLTDIAKIGKRYDIKEVNSGHAINFLIPKGLAIAATPETIKKYEIQKNKMEGERKVQEELLDKNIKNLEGTTLNISGKANDKGHLFAGLHRDEIVSELNKQLHISIDPNLIQLEHPIKELGEHNIEVKKGDKIIKFKLTINKL